MSKKPLPVDRLTLMVIASVIAVGGVIYELMLSTATSFLIGDATKSYSLGVGLSLFGMGIGSLCAVKLFKRPLLHFMAVELLLAILGGTSVIVLYAAYSVTKLYWLVFVLLTVAIGILIGFEIPLVMESYKKHKKDQNVFLTKILAADYIGALAGSLLFPFILLPYLGLIRSALIMGLINIGVVVILLVRAGRPVSRVLTGGTVLVIVLLAGLVITASRIERSLTTASYQDPVIFYKTSQYQRIVVTKHQDDVRLYLNNQLQFSSRDEARYHETLVHGAMTQAAELTDVLVLGGGDGMVAREVLKYPGVASVTNVDIDPAMTGLARDNWHLAELNGNAFSSAKVTVVNRDALEFVRGAPSAYDVVIVDLVDPANDRIAKLYSREFYAEIARKLKPGGVFITQATSTYFTPQAFWVIDNTIKQVFGTSTQLYANVPSFGEWGFVMSADPADPPRRKPEQTAYASDTQLQAARVLPRELLQARNDITSSVLTPQIHTVYNRDLSRWTY